MDPSRFDDFTKVLATSTTRRQALKTIVATTIGGILGLGGLGTAFAKCHGAGHRCGTNRDCCTSQCLTCQNHICASTCTSGETCQNGTCCLPSGTILNSCELGFCNASRCCSGSCALNGFPCAPGVSYVCL